MGEEMLKSMQRLYGTTPRAVYSRNDITRGEIIEGAKLVQEGVQHLQAGLT
jgi:hypothetical protein